MNLKTKKNILVSGTLAYDRIMDFPGYFKDRILPNKVHILSVSFLVNNVKENFGGTAGNIAYNLVLLGEKPKILGQAGYDFARYEHWLKYNKLDSSLIKRFKSETTASAYIITDRDDNQISGFYPGPDNLHYCQIVKKFAKVDLAIIAPEKVCRMNKYVEFYHKLKIPYIFDPGQNIGDFKTADLKKAITGAEVLIGNDYELELIRKILRSDLSKIIRMVKILVITKGAKGSEIYNANKKTVIAPAKPKNTSDPTGAGDAFRAGFIKGLVSGWPLVKCGRLASVVAVYTIEKYGTQTHRFTWAELAKRYRENYHGSL